jgi:hypothetical protein
MSIETQQYNFTILQFHTTYSDPITRNDPITHNGNASLENYIYRVHYKRNSKRIPGVQRNTVRITRLYGTVKILASHSFIYFFICTALNVEVLRLCSIEIMSVY